MADQLRQQLTRLIQTIRRSNAGVWLLLVFGWYGLHGYLASPDMPWNEIDIDRFITAIILIGLWTFAWAALWIWFWLFAVLVTAAVALALFVFFLMALSLLHAPPESIGPFTRNALVGLVIWFSAMNLTGAGAALSFKKHFHARTAVWLLSSAGWAGFGVGLCSRLIIR